MPYANQHAARMIDPDSFMEGTMRTKEIAPGISLILGKRSKDGPMETQAVRFDKEKYTAKEARAWLKEHDYAPVLFEPAMEDADKGAGEAKKALRIVSFRRVSADEFCKARGIAVGPKGGRYYIGSERTDPKGRKVRSYVGNKPEGEGKPKEDEPKQYSRWAEHVRVKGGRDARLPEKGTEIVRHYRGQEVKVVETDDGFSVHVDGKHVGTGRSLTGALSKAMGKCVSGYSFMRLGGAQEAEAGKRDWKATHAAREALRKDVAGKFGDKAKVVVEHTKGGVRAHVHADDGHYIVEGDSAGKAGDTYREEGGKWKKAEGGGKEKDAEVDPRHFERVRDLGRETRQVQLTAAGEAHAYGKVFEPIIGAPLNNQHVAVIKEIVASDGVVSPSQRAAKDFLYKVQEKHPDWVEDSSGHMRVTKAGFEAFDKAKRDARVLEDHAQRQVATGPTKPAAPEKESAKVKPDASPAPDVGKEEGKEGKGKGIESYPLMSLHMNRDAGALAAHVESVADRLKPVPGESRVDKLLRAAAAVGEEINRERGELAEDVSSNGRTREHPLGKLYARYEGSEMNPWRDLAKAAGFGGIPFETRENVTDADRAIARSIVEPGAGAQKPPTDTSAPIPKGGPVTHQEIADAISQAPAAEWYDASTLASEIAKKRGLSSREADAMKGHVQDVANEYRASKGWRMRIGASTPWAMKPVKDYPEGHPGKMPVSGYAGPYSDDHSKYQKDLHKHIAAKLGLQVSPDNSQPFEGSSIGVRQSRNDTLDIVARPQDKGGSEELLHSLPRESEHDIADRVREAMEARAKEAEQIERDNDKKRAAGEDVGPQGYRFYRTPERRAARAKIDAEAGALGTAELQAELAKHGIRDINAARHLVHAHDPDNAWTGNFNSDYGAPFDPKTAKEGQFVRIDSRGDKDIYRVEVPSKSGKIKLRAVGAGDTQTVDPNDVKGKFKNKARVIAHPGHAAVLSAIDSGNMPRGSLIDLVESMSPSARHTLRSMTEGEAAQHATTQDEGAPVEPNKNDKKLAKFIGAMHDHAKNIWDFGIRGTTIHVHPDAVRLVDKAGNEYAKIGHDHEVRPNALRKLLSADNRVQYHDEPAPQSARKSIGEWTYRDADSLMLKSMFADSEAPAIPDGYAAVMYNPESRQWTAHRDVDADIDEE
jgi:hypothetical protein